MVFINIQNQKERTRKKLQEKKIDKSTKKKYSFQDFVYLSKSNAEEVKPLTPPKT